MRSVVDRNVVMRRIPVLKNIDSIVSIMVMEDDYPSVFQYTYLIICTILTCKLRSFLSLSKQIVYEILFSTVKL